jgi:hypothetical protein
MAMESKSWAGTVGDNQGSVQARRARKRKVTRTRSLVADLGHDVQQILRTSRVLALQRSGITDTKLFDRDVRRSPSGTLHATVDPVFTSVGELVSRVTGSTGAVGDGQEDVVGDLVDIGTATGGGGGAARRSGCFGRRRRRGRRFGPAGGGRRGVIGPGRAGGRRGSGRAGRLSLGGTDQVSTCQSSSAKTTHRRNVPVVDVGNGSARGLRRPPLSRARGRLDDTSALGLVPNGRSDLAGRAICTLPDHLFLSGTTNRVGGPTGDPVFAGLGIVQCPGVNVGGVTLSGVSGRLCHALGQVLVLLLVSTSMDRVSRS